MALVAQYFLNDGSSGTSPTSIADSGPATTVGLTMTFGGSAAWTSLGTGKGLIFDATGSSQAASAVLNGSKYQTAFSGATAMVVEFVSDVSSIGCIASLADSTNANQAFACVVNSAGAWLDCFIINGWYRFPYTTGRHVWHLVIDSTAAAGSRATLYKDGSSVAVNTIFTEITASAALDSTISNWTHNVMYIGGEAGSVGAAYLTGNVYYVALYTSLSTIAANAANLATNDDADPNTPARVAWRRPFFDVSSWDPDPPAAPRRAMAPVSTPAAPAQVPYRRQLFDWQAQQEPTFYWQGIRSALVQAGASSAPGFSRAWWVSAAAASWEPEERTPLRARSFPVSGPPPVALPPFTRRWVPIAVDAWQPVDQQLVARAHVPLAGSVSPIPPTPVNPTDWRADYAAIIGQMFRGGGFPLQV
jgi:hypothetical protein